MAIGGIFGVNGQAHTEEEPADGVVPVCRVRTVGGVPRRGRRIDQALHAVVMEAYVHGVSTRSVDDLVQALGIDTGISKSEVPRICAGLDEAVTAFRTRTLGHTQFP